MFLGATKLQIVSSSVQFPGNMDSCGIDPIVILRSAGNSVDRQGAERMQPFLIQ